MTVTLRDESGASVPLTDAQKLDLRETIGAAPAAVRLSQAEVDSPSPEVLADETALYVLAVAPFTRYYSTGTELRALEGVDHLHSMADVSGLTEALAEIADDNAAALTAAQDAQTAAQAADATAQAAQTAVAGATAAATAATAAAATASTAAAAAQATADSATTAAAQAQADADALEGQVSAAVSDAAAAVAAAAGAQASVADLAGVPFLVAGPSGPAANAVSMAAGSRMSLVLAGQELTLQPRVDVPTQWTAGQGVAFVDLSFADPVAWDAAASNHARLTMLGDTTLGNPTNLVGGQVLHLKVKQDEVGGYALAFGTKFRFPGGTPPVVAPGAGQTTVLAFLYDDADDVLLMTTCLSYPA